MSKPEPKSIYPDKVRELAPDLVSRIRFSFLASIDVDQPRLRPVSPVRTDGFVVFVANLRS